MGVTVEKTNNMFIVFKINERPTERFMSWKMYSNDIRKETSYTNSSSILTRYIICVTLWIQIL